MPVSSPRARRLRRLKRQNTLLYRGYTQLAQDHMKLQELVTAAMRAQNVATEPTPEAVPPAESPS